MHLFLAIEAGLLIILFGWVMLLPLRDIKANQLFIIQKFETLMNKQDFLAAIADFKTEIATVSGKIDALEALINKPGTDVDPEIVAAFQDLKGSMDALNTKADNTPTV